MAIFIFWQLLTAANRYLQLSKHFLHFPHTCFISSSMRNVMFLPLKLAELLQFQYFWQLLAAYNSCQQLSKWFHLQLILTSFMQNFEFLAFKMTELWLFMYFQKSSLNCPDVCLTLCCFHILIFKLCLCVNSTALKFTWFHTSSSYDQVTYRAYR